MPYNTNISILSDGESAIASVFNRPLDKLLENTDFLKAQATGVTWITKIGAYTAIKGDGILASTTGGAWTLTLPASPSIGDEVGIIDQDGTFATNNLTIGRNGKNIMGLAEDMICSTNNLGFSLIYSGDATDGWRIK